MTQTEKNTIGRVSSERQHAFAMQAFNPSTLSMFPAAGTHGHSARVPHGRRPVQPKAAPQMRIPGFRRGVPGFTRGSDAPRSGGPISDEIVDQIWASGPGSSNAATWDAADSAFRGWADHPSYVGPPPPEGFVWSDVVTTDAESSSATPSEADKGLPCVFEKDCTVEERFRITQWFSNLAGFPIKVRDRKEIPADLIGTQRAIWVPEEAEDESDSLPQAESEMHLDHIADMYHANSATWDAHAAADNLDTWQNTPEIRHNKMSYSFELFSLLTKQTRMAKHLKYSAACQLAYQTYTSDDYVDASAIRTPQALLGENAALVENFDIQQVRAVPGFPELAEDVKFIVNRALPGSVIEVTSEGTLIDESTGFNMLLVQDKEKPQELILTFGGSSAGATKLTAFDEKILQEQWKANIVQGVGGVPQSTLQAVSAGEAVADLLIASDIDIVCAGHSKGGMEAIVVGLSLGKIVYADNPAPVVGARRLIAEKASERRVREGSSVLRFSKRYVHTVSIGIDPISHLMGPTRTEFGVHDHIRMASKNPLGAHVHVWESAANWIRKHPPIQDQIRNDPDLQSPSDEKEFKLLLGVQAQKEELRLQQEVQTVIEALNVDVPDVLQKERKRDKVIKALVKVRDQTGDTTEKTKGLLLKLWDQAKDKAGDLTKAKKDRARGPAESDVAEK